VIVDPHKAAARFLVDGHFRNDRNTHARTDHAEQAAELATLKNNLRMQACAITCRDRGIAEAVPIAQEKKRLGAQVF
jgi:hypothetical protein